MIVNIAVSNVPATNAHIANPTDDEEQDESELRISAAFQQCDLAVCTATVYCEHLIRSLWYRVHRRNLIRLLRRARRRRRRPSGK